MVLKGFWFSLHVYMQKEIIWINTEGPLVPRSSSKAAACLFVPYPVGRGRRDVDNQSPWQFLNLDSEQQGRVGHLLELLLNELVLCRLLEVLGFGDFVHKSQNLPSSLATPCPVREDYRRRNDSACVILRVTILRRWEPRNVNESSSHLGCDVSTV